MKKISIVVPTYNEELNILSAYEAVTEQMENIGTYDYEILFIDNCSTDETQRLIRNLCGQDERVKAIFNARNFGQMRSHYYGLINVTGDCAFLLHADLQNPIELLPEFIKAWEDGHKVVIGIKESSKENPIMFFLRSCYYKVMKNVSEVEQIQHFSDFELLDKDFLNVLRELKDPIPYLRGIVSEFGFKIKRITYQQNKRERGKTKANFRTLYDFALIGLTSYSKAVMRIATVLGGFLSVASIIVAFITFVRKLMNWDAFPAGVAAIGVGVFFLGSVQLFFIGLLGEYILSINTRVMNRPLVIEECRINFEETQEDHITV